MPHTPQTAVVRLLQSVTDARNIVPGERVDVRPHIVLLGPRDGLAALKAFRIAGGEKAVDPERFILFTDDNLPAADAAAANRRKQLLEAAAQAGLTRLIPMAGCEIAHAIEAALVVPGEFAVSPLPGIHRVGGIGALGVRVTARDVAAMLAGQKLSVTVPETVRADLTGQRLPLVSGRDVFFTVRRELTRDRLAGRALEIGALPGLALHERVALCAQAAHTGVFGVMCLADKPAVAELNRYIKRPYTTLEPEKDAAYAYRASVDLGHAQVSVIPPGVADDWRTVGEATGQAVRGVIITGGAEALRVACEIIKLRRLAPGVPCHVIPATRDVYAAALKADLLGPLMDGGVNLHPPGTSVDSLAEAGALVTTLQAPSGCWRGGIVAAATAACAGAIVHPERLDALPQRDSKLSSRRPKAE